MEKTGPANLEQTLDRIARAEESDGEQTTVGAVVTELGPRSFGPMLLLPGLITLLPIGGVPGVPTIMGLFAVLVSAQMLFGRQCFWLPDWMLRRSIAWEKLDKSRRWMLPPARFTDRFIRPRLTRFMEGVWLYLIAALSVMTGLMMPLMEVVPFSAISAGLVLTFFGLGLLARDGLLALLGMAAFAGSAWIIYAAMM
ncbi:Uncharacterized conserved protein [Marinobacter daqiaonensis]|uniref:Uncharacterized conserved protein n=1 Tax=Marinobacter daqiaonensis TaxID=650891 RepID=A0A1I6IDD4_9GAMM|nr:exopolysaccharide biosynthesis protein [Marinobacter daqiaonensis]SFR64742.1 Uncharacterized conserved protein [Marinobacter daqiaonensis]